MTNNQTRSFFFLAPYRDTSRTLSRPRRRYVERRFETRQRRVATRTSTKRYAHILYIHIRMYIVKKKYRNGLYKRYNCKVLIVLHLWTVNKSDHSRTVAPRPVRVSPRIEKMKFIESDSAEDTLRILVVSLVKSEPTEGRVLLDPMTESPTRRRILSFIGIDTW